MASERLNRVLITGGNGLLGRALTPHLIEAGYTVRVGSRSPRSPKARSDVEWAQTSFETGEGLAEAVKGADVIIHCATSYPKVKQVDVEGTKRLLALSEQYGVKHFIYISVIGADKLPQTYSQAKAETERILADSGFPFTVVRAAQFYSGFIEILLKFLTALPVGVIPKGFCFQPIDIDDVADSIVELINSGPRNKVLSLVGPRIYDFADLARTWLAAQGKRKPLLQIPVPGQFGAAVRAGQATIPSNPGNGLTWEAWLRREYGAGS
jgi:uncharacterized protein YbjT (DUF2867 family)